MIRRVAGLTAAAALLAGCATAPVEIGADDGLGPDPTAYSVTETSTAAATQQTPRSTDMSLSTEMSLPTEMSLSTETSLPTATSPPPMICPDDGVLVTVSGRDAAMGQRWLFLVATNCGSSEVDLTGHPEATVTGETRSVVAVPGGKQITDPGPSPILLAPGDQACAVVSWRTLVETGETVSAEEFTLAATPGRPAQVIAEPVDLGTTLEWFTTAWYQGQLPELAGPCQGDPSAG